MFAEKIDTNLFFVDVTVTLSEDLSDLRLKKYMSTVAGTYDRGGSKNTFIIHYESAEGN